MRSYEHKIPHDITVVCIYLTEATLLVYTSEAPIREKRVAVGCTHDLAVAICYTQFDLKP